MVGDWTGSGTTKIGVFNSTQAVWLLDYNGNYTWDGAVTDRFLSWGSPGDMPVVGDWNAIGHVEDRGVQSEPGLVGHRLQRQLRLGGSGDGPLPEVGLAG